MKPFWHKKPKHDVSSSKEEYVDMKTHTKADYINTKGLSEDASCEVKSESSNTNSNESSTNDEYLDMNANDYINTT